MTRTIQRGFTLIELVVVITILGILAAFAVPKFLSLDTQARTAALSGLQGSLRSASALAHSMYLVNGGTVTIDGATITTVNGYPTADAAGIAKTLQDTSGFVPSGTGPYVYTLQANCLVTYTAAAVGASPNIAQTISGC